MFFKCNPLFSFWTASWLSTSFASFSRGQPHKPNVNHCILTISTWTSPGASKQSWIPNPGRAPICPANFWNIYQGQGQHENWTWSGLWKFFISHMITWSRVQSVKRLNGWSSFIINLYLSKFGSHSLPGSGDILLFICYMTSCGHVNTGSRNFAGFGPSD